MRVLAIVAVASVVVGCTAPAQRSASSSSSASPPVSTDTAAPVPPSGDLTTPPPSTTTGDPHPIVTGTMHALSAPGLGWQPDGTWSCFAFSDIGLLEADPVYGTRFTVERWFNRPSDVLTMPVMWPPGFRARTAGDQVEVLDPDGNVVATTGEVYTMGGGGGARPDPPIDVEAVAACSPQRVDRAALGGCPIEFAAECLRADGLAKDGLGPTAICELSDGTWATITPKARDEVGSACGDDERGTIRAVFPNAG